MQNFLTIDYLEHGNEIQHNVFHLLRNHQILEKLDTCLLYTSDAADE